MMFSDETRIFLHGNDVKEVYLRPGEWFPQNIIKGGCSCVVWAGISLESKTQLVFIVEPNDGSSKKGLTSYL